MTLFIILIGGILLGVFGWRLLTGKSSMLAGFGLLTYWIRNLATALMLMKVTEILYLGLRPSCLSRNVIR